MKGFELDSKTFWNNEIKNITQESERLMDEIIGLCALIEPIVNPYDSELIRWQFWLSEERGTYSDYLKSHSRYDNDKYTKEEFYERFPDKLCWFELRALENERMKFLAINSFRIYIEKDGEEKNEPFPYDATKLLNWAKQALIAMIEELKLGVYNERIERELPYNLRYGVLSRKKYWELVPEEKEAILGKLTKEEVKEFLEIVESEGANYCPQGRITGMTFNKYFQLAYYAYEAADYVTEQVSPAILFMAKGEDFGGGVFNDIDFDSTEAFDGYYKNQLGYAGGHPWGVLMGSSRTRIMLHPIYDNGGYYFWFGGNPNFMIFEMVRFYLGLKRHNVPVYMMNPQKVIDYLKEEDLVGFVMDMELPLYCGGQFPNHKVYDYRHFDEKRHPELKAEIEWLPLRKVALKNTEGD